MVKRTQNDVAFRPIKSYYRNLASEDCKNVMDVSKQIFIASYLSFKKTHGCSLTECDYEDFNSFILNVDGFYNNHMKQLRHNYLKYTEVKNVKHERQWYVMMGTLRNAYKQGKEEKVTAVLYDMSQAS